MEGRLRAGGPGGRRWGKLASLLLTVVVVLLVGFGAVRVGLYHRHFIAAYPMNLVWLGGSMVAGVLVFRLNGAGVGLGAVAPWLGYGILAMALGLAVQHGASDRLGRVLGSAPGVVGDGLLVVVAALAQTTAKWIVLRFLGAFGALDRADRAIIVGLAVGLGFGLGETVILGEHLVFRHIGMSAFPLSRIWESAMAVGFHVFSTAALAMGLREGSVRPFLLVLTLHALDATIAGAPSGRGLRAPGMPAEIFVSVVALVVWMYYRTLGSEERMRAQHTTT